MSKVESVWFGSYVVAVDTLDAQGSTLYDLLGVGDEIIDTIDGPPPVRGWRVIAGQLPAGATVNMDRVVLAAPWDNPRSNRWMVM